VLYKARIEAVSIRAPTRGATVCLQVMTTHMENNIFLRTLQLWLEKLVHCATALENSLQE
jgi:hypothetical protein